MPPTEITENDPGNGLQHPFGNGSGGDAETAEMPRTRESLSAPGGAGEPTTHPTAVTPSLGVAASGDHCAVCGASMAPDQRYCLECGERRGQARFSAPVTTSSAGAVPADRRPASRGSRWSPGATLIAGVGTLLLALGIGVLIGRSGNSSSPASGNSKVQVVTVGAGSGGAAAASAATNSGAGATPAASSGGGSSNGHKKTAKTSTAASHTAAAATAKTVTQLPPPTVTVGAKGHGAGYQNGHFTGNFFGGGG